MEVIDNEMMLFDRLNVIRDTNKKYDLENNAYISFSGGKDSVVLHHLIDMALPNNQIPRLFINTGIEYNAIVSFVEREREGCTHTNCCTHTKYQTNAESCWVSF